MLTSDTDSISISVEAEESALFQGLHAEDNADGDITDEIRVASMSNFTERGKRTVNYAVFDSSGHAATLSRELVYTDYTSPRITLNKPLRFSLSEAESWIPRSFWNFFRRRTAWTGIFPTRSTVERCVKRLRQRRRRLHGECSGQQQRRRRDRGAGADDGDRSLG